jgi:uncharacterized protein (DUF2147 family)
MQTGKPSRRSMLALTLLAATAAVTPAALAQSPNDIVGIWETEDGGLKFEMFNAGKEYQARLLYGQYVMESDNVTFMKDTKNPDPALRSRSLKHAIILRGLTWQNGEWVGGSFYSVRNGATISCSAKVADGKLHMSGFVPGQTIVFRRAAG